jgi:hypothetical protein
MRAFSVLAAVAALVSTAAANNVVRIPMKKISDKEFVQQKLANAAGSTYGFHSAPGPGQVIVKDYQNAQYFGVVSLGGQDFEVM